MHNKIANVIVTVQQTGNLLRESSRSKRHSNKIKLGTEHPALI